MNKLNRVARWALPLVLLGCGTAAAGMATAAEPPSNWPQRQIRWIVPFPPGASADAISRVVAEKLSENLGQTVIVESRTGAGGDIGHAMVAKSPPDGYTLLFVVPGVLTNQFYMKEAVDPFKSLVPVIQLDRVPMVLLSKQAFKPTSLAQVLEAARARPGSVSCAAAGSLPQIGCELLRRHAGSDLLMVPFRGQAQASTSVMSGDVDLMFDVLGSAVPAIQSKRVRAIALTSDKRTASLPDVPTAAETVPEFKLMTWHGVMVPHGTPAAIVNKLNAALNDVLKDTRVRERLQEMGLDVAGGTANEFANLMKQESANYRAVLEAAGVKPE